VNSVVEMGRMIEINRIYTNIANMLAAAHDLHKTAIEKLADVPA
jgi:flagellar basal-body rod protein FlgF